jgi:hypothetical protein
MRVIALKHKYWTWYRVPYFLAWALMAVFYGTRIQQTLRYWSLLESWHVYPGRVYLLMTGILLFLIGIGVCVLLLLKKGLAVRWVSGLGTLVVVWFWVDQLGLSRIPDRLENLPFLAAGTLFFAIWTILFFRKES